MLTFPHVKTKKPRHFCENICRTFKFAKVLLKSYIFSILYVGLYIFAKLEIVKFGENDNNWKIFSKTGDFRENLHFSRNGKIYFSQPLRALTHPPSRMV
jgi:hypothetical protein